METTKANKAAVAAATTVAADNSDGKHLLRGLILRAEDVLGKLIYKLEKTPITLAEMVSMINSVHAFVDAWEKPLEDIRMDMLNIPGVSGAGSHPVEQLLQQEEKKLTEKVGRLNVKMEKMEESIVDIYNGLDESAEPTFEFLEQSLEKYKPNHIGQCVISSVGPGQRSFCMVDRDHPDGTKLFAAMQSMSCARIFQLPPPGEIFGIFLEDSVFRAVRNKPTAHSPSRKNYIRLVDTGEILPYDSALPMCTLSEYYRRIPAFAIRCVLVSVVSDPFCQDFDRFLKKMLGTSLHFKVISTSSSGRKSLFVELSQHPIVVRDKPSSTTSSPESTPPNKGKPIFGRPNRSGPLFSPSPPKPPRADIFAVDSAEQNNPFTSIRFPSVSIGEKRTGESNCSSKNGLNAAKVGSEKIKRIVPPIGSHVMLVPKFIRDVGHMWCHVVKADYVNPDFREMELRMNDPEYAMRYRKLQGRPQMSQRVFAKYVDKRWYRAEVIRYFDERNVLVFYVDYGNSEMVSLGEVHEWDETFGYLPYQAVLCKLSNLKPAKRFHVQAVVELNRTLLNKRVEAQIVDNSNPWEVTIYDQDGFDVSCGLVIAGLAKRIKEDDEQEAGQEAPAG